MIEKDGHKYYKLQDDYTKQSFYIWLNKEERKQYEYEDYLLDEIEEKDKEIKRLKEDKKKFLELIQNDYFEDGSFKNYYEVLNILQGE